jgi:hypothetical protein
VSFVLFLPQKGSLLFLGKMSTFILIGLCLKSLEDFTHRIFLSLTLREEQRLRVFENRVLRRMFLA